MSETGWLDPPISARLDYLIARNRRAEALRVLDRIIGSDYGLFRSDRDTLAKRQAALRYKVDLLLEWERHGEALAWLCLETDLNPGNVHAQALKEHLKRVYNVDDFAPSADVRPSVGPPRTRKSRVTWEGVAGMRDLKLTLEADIIMPLLEPDIYRRYKVPLPNGVLFFGPPGCGKTFVARKLAEMLDYGFVELKPSDLASIYVHGTQGKIGELFDQATKDAPTLLFFDELDAFIPRREADTFHHYAAEVNEFLAQLNECSKRSILVIGATNYLNRIDGAARRPGRFDKKIYVGPPDLPARIEAMGLYLRNRPQVAIDLCALLSDKDGYSFADLELIANEAAREALQTRVPISAHEVEVAFDRIPPSITPGMIDAMSAE